MNKLWTSAVACLFLIYVGMMVGPAIAQSQVAFWQWPALWSVSEDFVVKRGDNGKLYSRMGWGNCVVTETGEIRDFVRGLPTDRYINARDYASQRLSQDGLSDEDRANCPQQPLEVKPTWRGSRPVYAMQWDYVNHAGTRLGKTPYRAIDGACLRYNARSNGEITNYWMLAPDTLVYRDGEPVQVSSIEGHVAAICENVDVPVTDWRAP